MWELDVPTSVRRLSTMLLFWRSIPLTSATVGPSPVRLVALSPVCAPQAPAGSRGPRPTEETPPSRIDWWGSSGGGSSDDGGGGAMTATSSPPSTGLWHTGAPAEGWWSWRGRAVIGMWRVRSHWAAPEACVVWGRPPQSQNLQGPCYISDIMTPPPPPPASHRDGWIGGGWMFQEGRSETCRVYSGGLVLWAPDGPKAPHVGRREQTSIVFN